MSTFLELQNRVLNQFGANDQESRDAVKDFINEVIFEIDSEQPQAPHLQAEASVTASNGVRTISLPSDYDHSLNLQLTVDSKLNPPLTFLDRRAWIMDRVENQSNGEPKWYSIWNSTIEIAPLPNQDYTGTLTYYKYATELSNDSDTSDITDTYPRWEHVIIKGALAKLYEYYASDGQLIQRSFDMYELAKRRFRSWIRRNYDKRPDSTRIRTWKEVDQSQSPFIDAVLRQ